MQSVPPSWVEEGLNVGVAVFAALRSTGSWEEAREQLLEAFELSQAAARSETPVVYVVHNDDLLGRRGAPSAMVATGLLSAARTAALELTRAGVSVNVLAVDDGVEPATTVDWIERLGRSATPTGELIHLGGDHLGKALP